MGPRSLRNALIASAALNLFLLAASVTLIVLAKGGSRHHLPQRPTLRAAAQSLSPTDRNRFVVFLGDEGDSIQATNRRARALRNAAWAALGGKSFDAGAAKSWMARARALNEAARGRVENDVIDFAAALPLSERAAFGEAMRRQPVGSDHGAAVGKAASQP